MYSTILIPLDGSRRAERILPHVEELAHRFEAKVIFLMVEEPTPVNGGKEGRVYEAKEISQRVEDASRYLAGLQGEFRAKNIAASYVVEQGPVVPTIINVAERENASLIAMASHGRGGLSRVFYGSVAAGVMQRVDRPLLLVRSRRDI